MLRSCILALKGCDSTYISLDGRIVESKLIKKFKILLVQRRLVNIALENMLIAIVDPSVSAFVSCMRYWIFLVDSSLDFLLDDLQNKTLGPAGLLSKIHIQIQIIRWLFTLIAPKSMLSEISEAQLANWDLLALMVYNTSRFWERFPYRYDLLATLGSKIHNTHLLLDDYLSKRTKRMYHRDTIDPPMIVESYIQVLLYHDLYNHVAAAMSSSNNINKPNSIIIGSEVTVGSFANIVSIDNQQLWQQQLDSSSSNFSDSTNLLFRVIQTLQSSSVLSAAISAISSERGGMSVEALDLNPMNSFDYELETFVKRQFDAPHVSDDDKLQALFQHQLSVPVVDMSSHVSAKDIPAAKPSPNKKKATFFDHHPPSIAPATQPADTNKDNKMIVTLPLGAAKSVDKDLAAEAAQDMLQRFATISQNADYRKMKAIWQIRRLKRLKAAKVELKELYSDYNCTVYFDYNQGKVVEAPSAQEELHIEVKADEEPVEVDDEQQELPSVSRFEEDWLSEEEPEAKNTDHQLAVDIDDASHPEVESKKSSEFKPGTKTEFVEVQEDATNPSESISDPKDTEDEIKDDDIKEVEEDSVDSVDEQLDLVKHFQDDDLIVAEVNEEQAEQKRVRAILERLRKSLRIDGLQAILQGEESIRELCRDINTSVLLVGLANGAFTINFTNITSMILTANEGQSSLTRLVKSGVELSYRGVLSLSDAYGLQMKVKDTQLSKQRNQILLKQLVIQEQFLEHVKSFHEFFLMSSHRCSSFLFDVCQHVVEKRFKRLIKRDLRQQQAAQQHEEQLWSRVSLQLALREAMTYFSTPTAAHFKLAKYRFTMGHLQTMPSFQQVTWMDYTLPSSIEWSMLLSNTELHQLKIAYEVPNELCGLFFAEEFMDDISKLTKRYLELGQLISCFRILSIEARRNMTMNDRQQQRGSNLHLQLFAVQQTIQSLLRYFNDRQIAVMTSLYQSMRNQCHNGLQSLLSLWQEYGRDLRRATFTPTSDEMRITNAEIAHESLESGVLLKFCVEKIFQECRLFAVRLFELLFHESDGEDDDDEERLIILEDELQASAEKVEEYKLHIQELSRTVYQADLREHVLRLEQLVCQH